MTFTLDDAMALAHFAHRNQRDQAGMPYIDHPLRVLQRAQGRGTRPYVQIAAVLHDVIEDTPFTAEMLETLGVPSPAIRLIEVLTHHPDEPRDQYIARIIQDGGPDAVGIKLDDIGDNTLDWRLAYLPTDRQDRLVKKYTQDRERLLGAR